MGVVIVVGGGASGMISAITSAKQGNRVILFEKNEKLGKKLYITGKGRCNVTNDCSVTDFINNVPTNPKFLYSAINAFTPTDVMDFFENNGLNLKVERGKRVFPASDKSSDVIKTLEKCCKSYGVEIKLNSNVNSLILDDDKVIGVNVNNEKVYCDSVIVCTGGLSYPLTGSTGDGFKFAKTCGHKIINPVASLVGIEIKGDFYKKVQGISLKNVQFTAMRGQKKIYSEFGEMLFTHYGVSGPIVLSCSAIINKMDLNDISFSIDFKPALSEEVLDNRLIREFESFDKKSLANAMFTLLPKNLSQVVIEKASVSFSKKCSDITVEERKRLVFALKNFTFKPRSLRPIEEAIITSGGIDVKEINPKTMESKLIKNLYFAGEVLDVDCFTGGFNIQAAFSTGFVAGQNAK